MDWLKKYADLPEAERIRRIAALVATAVERFSSKERSLQTAAANPKVVNASGFDVTRSVGDVTEERMLAYLTRVGAATPRDFQVALGLSPMTVTRRLARLRATGLVVVEGKTRSARYLVAKGCKPVEE